MGESWRSPGSTPDDEPPFGCVRPTKGVLLLLADGRTIPMRCGASNCCDYCAWLASVENSIVVGMDARWRQPDLGMTLTTHRPGFDLQRFRVATASLFRWLRAELGADVEYLGLMEWTREKGRGRHPHMHALVKLLAAIADAEISCSVAAGRQLARADKCRTCLECRVSVKWAKLTDGAWVVECRPLRTAGGAIAYMVGHHHKREQAPPISARGVKRMRPSKGYFKSPAVTAAAGAAGVSEVAWLRSEAKRTIAQAAQERVALARLVELDVPDHLRDDILDELVHQVSREPRPLPVAVLRDGRMRVLSTGQVLDGAAADIYAEATGR